MSVKLIQDISDFVNGTFKKNSLTLKSNVSRSWPLKMTNIYTKVKFTSAVIFLLHIFQDFGRFTLSAKGDTGQGGGRGGGMQGK